MLSNVELRRLVERQGDGADPLYALPESEQGSDADISLIQPASIDLNAGSIRALSDEGTLTKISRGGRGYTIPPGGFAIVQTREVLAVPETHAGIMFPKSGGFAQHGILITNFGHVDPGYKGKLNFTVLNLSHASREIRVGEKIATLLLFKLQESADPSWNRNISGHELGDEEVRGLGPDLLDFKNRVEGIVRAKIFQGTLYGALVGVAASIAVGLLGILGSFHLFLEGRISTLEDEVAVLKYIASTGASIDTTPTIVTSTPDDRAAEEAPALPPVEVPALD